MADVTSPFGFPYPEDTDLVRDGASDIENLAEGVNDYLTGGYLYAGTIYYTSSGSFEKADPLGTGDIGLRAIRVRMVGAGGGAGGVQATTSTQLALSRPGGGGGYSERFILADTLSASETVTRGAGGAAGAAGNNSGSVGGTSSFALGESYQVTALGGDGGGGGAATSTFPAIVQAAQGAELGVGDVTERGGQGATGGMMRLALGTYDLAAADSGPSKFAGGAKRVVSGTGNDGENGAGGGCVINIQSQVARAGGAGGNGLIAIDVFV
jgi:hypothetical protein